MTSRTPVSEQSSHEHEHEEFSQPIVLKYKAKKNKKAKYSRGLRDPQRMEAHLSKAARRAAQAVAASRPHIPPASLRLLATHK